MKIDKFKKKAQKHLDALEELFNKLPEKGLTSEECQRVNLVNSLLHLGYAVNGTEQEDLDE